jgi:hypothetical protein
MTMHWRAFAGLLVTFVPACSHAQARRSTAVPRPILEQLLDDTAFTDWVFAPRDSIAANLIAERLDLNGDGRPELKIRGINSVCQINNCVAWIYRQTGSGYERLLDAGIIQQLEPQATTSHGYRDIMTFHHGSAWDSDLTLYRFDGRAYKRARCFVRTYRYLDAQGRSHELKKPRITRVACAPDS